MNCGRMAGGTYGLVLRIGFINIAAALEKTVYIIGIRSILYKYIQSCGNIWVFAAHGIIVVGDSKI